MISAGNKKLLLGLAKQAINNNLLINDEIKNKFSHLQGAFVTLKKNNHLRGCIGYPFPVFPLWKAIINSAKAAAYEDPRFPPLNKNEINDIQIEISVLTIPQQIIFKETNELLDKIKIGKDGLIIEYNNHSGLLLPQVPIEWHWDVETFLNNLCKKANLPAETWKNKKIKISKFQAEIFNS